jgi:serine phosphatase RsbU (regulator of sigma subunit)/anti-anti-sigma regulatory factor
MHRGAFDFAASPIDQYDVFVRQVHRALTHKQLQESHDRLLIELEKANLALQGRLAQLELAHHLLQSQAVAVQMDLDRAMRIQRGLLPRSLPFSERISVSTVYQPAGKVGGDFYDVFELDEDRVGIYVADTSGHGVSSAMVTMFLKRAFQPVRVTNGRREVVEPSQMLRDLNRVVIEEGLGLSVFITMVYLVVDTRTGEAAYATAGHPPFLVRRRDGTIERHRIAAPALGINPDVKYSQEGLRVAPGELIVLYTDGVTDLRNAAGAFYGIERLESLTAVVEPHADTVAAQVEQALDEFGRGDRLTDDATVVVVGMEPQRVPFAAAKPPEPRGDEAPVVAGPGVSSASHDERTFVRVMGAGTWKESKEVADLCAQAEDAGARAIVLDFSECTHLDSTFLGALHHMAVEADKTPSCRFELQNIPGPLLRTMSELGLTTVLMHFRPDPLPLPPSMRPIHAATPAKAQLGQWVLQAHDALVEADPRNADRFAALLKVLHDQAGGSRAGG